MRKHTPSLSHLNIFGHVSKFKTNTRPGWVESLVDTMQQESMQIEASQKIMA